MARLTSEVAHMLKSPLDFSKLSKDQSGKATLLPADNSIVVHGVLFEISNDDCKALDIAEGKGNGYERYTLKVQVAKDDGLIPAHSYLATKTDSKLQPYNWYKALVLAGAIRHGLPKAHRLEISDLKAVDDPCPCRESRCEAIAVLKEAGYECLIGK